MKTYSEFELNYWGDVFATKQYARYMTFEQFMQAPEYHESRIEDGRARPLLARQRQVADGLSSSLSHRGA